MPIDEDIWTVYMDGRPTEDRGLSRAAAEARANYWARGIESHKASDKRRAPCVEIRRDVPMMKQDEALYKWAKQGG